jgi:membrane-associated protein
VTELLTRLGEHAGSWLYLIAAFFVFAEAAILLGIVIPGETALLVAGYFCHSNLLRLWLMVPIAVIAAIAGDSVGFEFGRKFGPQIRESTLGRRVGETRWQTADDFLQRHGGKAVFLGRMTALLRALTPSVAGMSGLRYRTFFILNAVGGVLWGAGCVLLGYAFASALHRVEQYVTWAPIVVLVVVVVGAASLHFWRRRREHVTR